MGNAESDLNNNDKLSARDKEKILQQNLLQQEIIKNQILQGKLEETQRQMDTIRREQQLVPNSKNPLLTNPEVQREFLRNKKMQQELQRRAQLEQKKHIQDSSYNQINNFLSGLQVEEKEDQINKSHLFINQGTRYQNIVPPEQKKPEIGINNSDRDKLIRLIKKTKRRTGYKK